jgi:hypothetical protein
MIGRDLIVRLTSYEVALAASVGVRRQISALAGQRIDNYGYDGDGWSHQIQGAGGEMAVAKTLGVYWDASVDTFKQPDLPGRIQVRTRSGVGDRRDLIVRPDDADGDVFVHVIGTMPRFTIVGWRMALESKDPSFLRSYGNRPPAYFVPSELMRAFPIIRLDHTEEEEREREHSTRHL